MLYMPRIMYCVNTSKYEVLATSKVAKDVAVCSRIHTKDKYSWETVTHCNNTNSIILSLPYLYRLLLCYIKIHKKMKFTVTAFNF